MSITLMGATSNFLSERAADAIRAGAQAWRPVQQYRSRQPGSPQTLCAVNTHRRATTERQVADRFHLHIYRRISARGLSTSGTAPIGTRRVPPCPEPRAKTLVSYTTPGHQMIVKDRCPKHFRTNARDSMFKKVQLSKLRKEHSRHRPGEWRKWVHVRTCLRACNALRVRWSNREDRSID